MERTLFVNSVTKALQLNSCSSIKRFSLSCKVLSDASHIISWLQVALAHKVQQLCLRLDHFEETFVLPDCIFTSDSLAVLELDMRYNLMLGSSFCFSSLKSLSLSKVIIPGNSIQQLFSGLPVLEDLSIANCNWENVTAVCISAPMLKTLFIGDDGLDEQYDDIDDQNNSNGCQILISGRSLQSFSFSGCLRNDYYLFDTISLVKASVEVYGGDWDWMPDEFEAARELARNVAYRVYKFLRAFSGVESLTLCWLTVRAINYTEELYSQLPVFSNLTCLQFSAMTYLNYEVVPRILQNSPCLNSLIFSEDVYLFVHRDKEWKFDPVPPCFLTHLKTMKIGDYWGEDSQLDAVRVLLENAVVLETIVISFNEYELDLSDLDKVKKIKEQLLELQKAPNCEVVFY